MFCYYLSIPFTTHKDNFEKKPVPEFALFASNFRRGYPIPLDSAALFCGEGGGGCGRLQGVSPFSPSRSSICVFVSKWQTRGFCAPSLIQGLIPRIHEFTIVAVGVVYKLAVLASLETSNFGF